MFKYNGHEKGATWISFTSLPGRQPISNSFNGISSVVKATILPVSPRFNSAKVFFKAYLDLLQTKVLHLILSVKLKLKNSLKGIIFLKVTQYQLAVGP